MGHNIGLHTPSSPLWLPSVRLREGKILPDSIQNIYYFDFHIRKRIEYFFLYFPNQSKALWSSANTIHQKARFSKLLGGVLLCFSCIFYLPNQRTPCRSWGDLNPVKLKCTLLVCRRMSQQITLVFIKCHKWCFITLMFVGGEIIKCVKCGKEVWRTFVAIRGREGTREHTRK